MSKQSASQRKPEGKRRGRATKAEKAEALRLLHSGLSVEEVSKRTGFRVKVLSHWLGESNARTAPGFPTSRPTISEDPPHAPGDPAKAYEAIGAQAPTTEGQGSPSATPGATLPPPLSPDQLMVLVKGIDTLVMKGITGAKFSGLDPAEVTQLTRMPEDELAMLTELAPYAAEYSPLVIQYVKPMMALLFVGGWSYSVVIRTKTIAKVHAERFPTMAKKANAEKRSNG